MIRRQTAVLAFLLAMGILWRGPTLLAHAFGNLVMIDFRDALLLETTQHGGNRQSGVYSVFASLPKVRVESQITVLQRIAALDPNSLALRWGLGRLALAASDFPIAAEALKPIAERARYNPLLYNDALIAFSRGGLSDQAIALYESRPPPAQTQVISDSMTIAYLEAEGQGALAQARRLRPGDLYVNYHFPGLARGVGAGRGDPGSHGREVSERPRMGLLRGRCTIGRGGWRRR